MHQLFQTKTFVQSDVQSRELFPKFVAIIWVYLIFYGVFFFYWHAYLSLYIIVSGICFFLPLVLVLNSIRLHRTSKMVFIVSCNLFVSSGIIGIPDGSSAEFYFISASLLTWFLFDFSEKLCLAFSLTFPLATWIIVDYFPRDFFPSSYLPTQFPLALYKNINFMGAYIISPLVLIAFLSRFIKEHEKSIQQQKTRATNLEQSYKIIKSQNETLLYTQSIAKIGSWNLDADTKAILWSKYMFTLFSYEKTLGEPCLETLKSKIHPDDRFRWETSVNRCLQSGTSYSINLRILTFNPSQSQHRWIRETGRAVRNPKGQIIEIQGTSQDVTDEMNKEHSLKMVLDSTQIGFWKWDIQNDRLEWDDKMYEICSLSRGNVNHRMRSFSDWEKSFCPSEKYQITSHLKSAIASSNDLDTTWTISTSNGSRKNLAIRAIIERNANGIAERMSGLAWDRTREAELEKSLTEQKHFLNAVLDNIPSMIAVKDFKNHLKFMLINKAGCNLLGYKESQIIGKSDSDLYQKEQAAFYQMRDEEIFNSRKPLKIEMEELETARGTRFIRSQIVPTYDSNHNNQFLISISDDITQEIEIQNQIAIERNKSVHQSKLATLGEMAAGIAHEINNPLAIIDGTAALLEKNREDLENFQEKIEKLRKAASRISKIVAGLKKFSRTSGSPIRESIELSQILGEVEILTQNKIRKSRVEFTFQIEPGLVVRCDEVEIGQVLINLINNAVDAVKTKESRWVRVHAFKKDQLAVIRVIDSGNGIPTAILDKIFNPFFTTKNVNEGTGLGLSISKGIIESHGGTLEVATNEENTCFEIKLPQHLS